MGFPTQLSTGRRDKLSRYMISSIGQRNCGIPVERRQTTPVRSGAALGAFPAVRIWAEDEVLVPTRKLLCTHCWRPRPIPLGHAASVRSGLCCGERLALPNGIGDVSRKLIFDKKRQAVAGSGDRNMELVARFLFLVRFERADIARDELDVLLRWNDQNPVEAKSFL